MPAAAVIPAPLVYINIVVVKTLVVGGSFCLLFRRCVFSAFRRRGRAMAEGCAETGMVARQRDFISLQRDALP